MKDYSFYFRYGIILRNYVEENIMNECSFSLQKLSFMVLQCGVKIVFYNRLCLW